MKIFHMECFVALARCATFHEAAAEMYLSQSAFSNNIQTVEQELGIRLVSRESRGFTLTDAGEAFLSYAENIINEYNTMRALLTEYKSETQNRLTIYTNTVSSYSCNDLFVRFKLYAPDVHTEINDSGDENIVNVLGSREDAVCVVFSKDESGFSDFKSSTILRDTLVIFVSKEHRLAESDSIIMRELKDETLQIITERQSAFLYKFVTQQCAASGFSPKLSTYGLWYSTMADAVREMNYVAVIPGRAAKNVCPDDMKIIEIRDSEPFYVSVAMSEKCHNPAAHQFFEFAQNISDK